MTRAGPAPFEFIDAPEALLKRRRRRLALSLAFLSGFLAWQGFLLRRFVRIDTRPPSWDQSVHMEIALDYRNAIAQRRWGDVWRLPPKPGMPPFPPLYHLALMRAYDAPSPAQAALWVNFACFCVLCVCVFGLIFSFRPDATALAGTIAFACAPAVQALLTTQLIDLSVVACAAAAYWALVRSGGFKRWPSSLAFGALFAAGMMHKWSFFSYMIPAYLLGLKALNDRRSGWKAAAAAALALAGFAPWYLAHAAVLLPRLVQASSDFAIPVWQGQAFWTYLLASIEGLGPAFWLFAWIGLLVPHYFDNEDQGWLVWSSVVCSYLFWTIVPNRQMRFLLPGLPGLAVALCGAWPKPLIWIVAALQLAFAANFMEGWIPPISVPAGAVSLPLFPSGAPRAEDWKIAEILRGVERRIAPGQAFANLTLVANAPVFNGPTLTWERKRLGLSRVNVRGVNKRLCELSPFVLLKDGQLGPDSVIAGLPEAAGTIAEPKGWFQGAYERVDQWSLPDGSRAVLYGQKRPASAPFKSRATRLSYYETGAFSAHDLSAELGAWDSARGVYPLARLSASEAALRGLRIVKPRLELEDVLLVPAGDLKKSEWDELRFLELKTLRVRSAAIDARDLRAFLERRFSGLSVAQLELDRTLKLAGAFGGVPVSAEASVALEDSPRRLVISLLDARVGQAPVPRGLLGAYGRVEVPLDPTPDLPFRIELAGLTLKDGKLSIP